MNEIHTHFYNLRPVMDFKHMDWDPIKSIKLGDIKQKFTKFTLPC